MPTPRFSDNKKNNVIKELVEVNQICNDAQDIYL